MIKTQHKCERLANNFNNQLKGLKMLVHTTYTCYRKSSTPIRKGFTAKDRYDRALKTEKEYYDNKPKEKFKKIHHQWDRR